MSKAIVWAAALALAGWAHAQQPAAPSSPAKKELVAKVLQLQQPGIENLARQMAEQPAMQMLQQVSIALQQVPAERREALARDIQADARKYAEEAVPIVRERAVRLGPSTIGPLLEERFSEDELRQIVALLESPVNRKFQALAPEMQRAISEKLVAETRSDIEVKVRALDASIRARLQPPGAASAPAARPASAPRR